MIVDLRQAQQLSQGNCFLDVRLCCIIIFYYLQYDIVKYVDTLQPELGVIGMIIKYVDKPQPELGVIGMIISEMWSKASIFIRLIPVSLDTHVAGTFVLYIKKQRTITVHVLLIDMLYWIVCALKYELPNIVHLIQVILLDHRRSMSLDR